MNELVERCDIRTGEFIDDKYAVEMQLGEGTFGKVFKVTDQNNGKTLALKLFKFWELPAEQRKVMLSRFKMEYETGKIDSNYLIRSVENGYLKGNPYIVMEFCPNGDLLQLINNNKQVDLVKIGREVLFGLKDLHRCGKVHRDLKPENVLIKEDGTAVLTDFGICGDRKKQITVTDLFGRPAEITGTIIYMAPEQAKPKNREVTVLPTMDIFAYGVMMYQLITGAYPFGQLNDDNDLVLYLRNAREGNWNRKRLSDSPKGKVFDEAISGCLKPDFKQRLQTVDMVLSLLPQSEDMPQMPIDEGDGDFQKTAAVNGLLLRVMQGEEHGSVYKLNELLKGKSRVITVGCNDSLTNNILPITENFSRYISRKHCTLEISADRTEWFIRDGQWDKRATNGWKQSLNGTFVNSSEVPSGGMKLTPGDIITIGDVKLRAEGY